MIVLTAPGTLPIADDKQPASQSISLYLLNVLPAIPTPSEHQRPLQVTLQYLLTISGNDPLECHQSLGNITFAALKSAYVNVILEPVKSELWQAFDVIPQPSIMLEMLASLPSQQQDINLVTHEPELRIDRMNGRTPKSLVDE